MISKITQEISSKIQPLQELKRVKLSDISDWNNTNLFELKVSNYETFKKEIKSIVI